MILSKLWQQVLTVNAQLWIHAKYAKGLILQGFVQAKLIKLYSVWDYSQTQDLHVYFICLDPSAELCYRQSCGPFSLISLCM